MSEHLLNWLGGTLQRKFPLAALAFILGLTFTVPDFESLDENDSINDQQAALCVNEVARGNAQERVESTHSRLFSISVENASPFSLSTLFLPPAEAGQDLLHVLTLQKK